MGNIYPTKEVLEDRLKTCFSWFDCCKANLERQENGSPHHKRCLQHSLNAMKQIIEIEEMLEISNDIEKNSGFAGERAA